MMWNGLGVLLILSLTMAVASFLAGSLPLTFALSPRQLRLLTACGTGVLVGTSLIVIIPEGIETLYSANPTQSIHERRSILPAGSQLENIHNADPIQTTPGFGARDINTFKGHQTLDIRIDQDGSGLTGPDDGKPVSDHDALKEGTPHKPDLDGEQEEQEETNGNAHGKTTHHGFEPHSWVGISVIAGFVLMYLIDNIPKLAVSSSQSRPSYISLDGLGLRRRPSETSREDGDGTPASAGSRFLPSSTTTGLVIHSAADGIALGASTTSSSQKLGFVVFLALMIHKAPAAFGLTAVLLKQGLSKRRIKTHLLIFSLAAPVGALATWGVAQLVGNGPNEAPTTEFSTGILLLFSGGTFLYVAMHTMQESSHDDEETTGSLANGYANPYAQHEPKPQGPTLTETLVTVAGMLLPLLTQIGHSHAHGD